MGWSCNRDAALTMEAITNHCIGQTGMQNVYLDGGNRYMIEWSRREHNDGAITGTVYKYLPDERITKSTSIRIEGDGKISRGPKCLKSITVLRQVFIERGRESVHLYRGSEVTEEALYVEVVKYGKAFGPGGVNAHVGKSLGYIPYPTEAYIIDNQTGDVLVSWKAGMFQVYELPESKAV